MKMIKNLMAVALAFTFVFVGAQAADAAPNQPTKEYHPDDSYIMFSHDEDYTSEQCVDCHSPSTVPTTMDETHEALLADHADNNIGCDAGEINCHAYEITDPEDPNEGDVECGACHGTQDRESWERTFAEDNTTEAIESDDGEGHHLEDDGTQEACVDCHGNMSNNTAAPQDPNVVEGYISDLGFVGDVEIFEYENDDTVEKSVGIDPYKTDYEGDVATTELGSTFTVYNSKSPDQYLAGTWAYNPSEEAMEQGEEVSFMLEGNFKGSSKAEFVLVTVSVEAGATEADLIVDPTIDGDADKDGIRDSLDATPYEFTDATLLDVIVITEVEYTEEGELTVSGTLPGGVDIKQGQPIVTKQGENGHVTIDLEGNWVYVQDLPETVDQQAVTETLFDTFVIQYVNAAGEHVAQPYEIVLIDDGTNSGNGGTGGGPDDDFKPVDSDGDGIPDDQDTDPSKSNPETGSGIILATGALAAAAGLVVLKKRK